MDQSHHHCSPIPPPLHTNTSNWPTTSSLAGYHPGELSLARPQPPPPRSTSLPSPPPHRIRHPPSSVHPTTPANTLDVLRHRARRHWPRERRPSPHLHAQPRACEDNSCNSSDHRQQHVPPCRAHRRCSAAVDGHAPPWAAPPWWAITGDPPGSATSFSGTTYRRFVHFARRPVVTRARLSPFWRSVAATSYAFSRRSDHWIGDFFAPSQSRFAGPTSSACISSTAAPFGMLPVLVQSWTLWLQWDPLYLSAVQVIEIAWGLPAGLEETQ
ncbi:formin-like protein 5 [Iris pallida]|uniref:Formin-like protein 5 n=1 Tax=Iris pallida TaxID=29817 RepID=A0AAX6I7W5_IRIPA|nr:formin-like protein 5 [Iris pallida]